MNEKGTVWTLRKSCLSPLWLLVIVLTPILFLPACAGSPKTPDWVTGTKAVAYPDDQYLIGVGQGSSRPVAEDRAYAAISRIFKAEVTSQARDWESYLNLERKGHVQTERRLTVETMTKVSTDKVLENVTIAELWSDPQSGLYSALAVLNRGAARAALSGRIADLDEAIGREVKEARAGADKLTKLRGLRRAIKNLITREAYNTDLRVVSGRGTAAGYSVSALTGELEKFLNESLVVAVEITGDQAEAVRQSVMEGLVREGLPVTARSAQQASGENGSADLLIKGETRLWPADLPDPRFRYARWCADFVILDSGAQRVLGSVAQAGREGHLTYQEASGRALKALQQEVSSALAKSLAEHIYGDPPPESASAPAACPKP